MYQMERTKLSEKYKIKDEAIRSLSTQLQVNRVSLDFKYQNGDFLIHSNFVFQAGSLRDL